MSLCNCDLLYVYLSCKARQKADLSYLKVRRKTSTEGSFFLGGQLAPPQITYDFSMPPPTPHRYGNNFRPNTLPPGGAGHFQGAYGMGFPDPKLNRTWPVNNLAGSG